MKIKDLRERAGISKTELARIMGVDVAAVCRWDSGDAMPRAAKLPKLADVLGCSIDALFGRESPGRTSV